jgi:hypothetical protein
MYEITFIDSGKTVRWSRAKCYKHFGKDEFKEILAGYMPHIVAVKV